MFCMSFRMHVLTTIYNTDHISQCNMYQAYWSKPCTSILISTKLYYSSLVSDKCVVLVELSGCLLCRLQQVGHATLSGWVCTLRTWCSGCGHISPGINISGLSLESPWEYKWEFSVQIIKPLFCRIWSRTALVSQTQNKRTICNSQNYYHILFWNTQTKAKGCWRDAAEKNTREGAVFMVIDRNVIQHSYCLLKWPVTCILTGVK